MNNIYTKTRGCLVYHIMPSTMNLTLINPLCICALCYWNFWAFQEYIFTPSAILKNKNLRPCSVFWVCYVGLTSKMFTLNGLSVRQNAETWWFLFDRSWQNSVVFIVITKQLWKNVPLLEVVKSQNNDNNIYLHFAISQLGLNYGYWFRSLDTLFLDSTFH